MTFKKFEEIVKQYRPELVVSKHGDYNIHNSKYTLGVIYPNQKVYNYSGTYEEVLAKLNIEVISKKDIQLAKERVEQAEKKYQSALDGTINMLVLKRENETKQEAIIRVTKDKFNRSIEALQYAESLPVYDE